MTFEDILALCLDALEHGETIEHCLTRYPEHAAELAPLLSLATAVRSAPQPRLSAGAFARGYAAVVAQVHYQHEQQAPFHPMRKAVPQKSATTLMRVQPVVARQLIAAPPPLARPFLFVHKAQTALLACLVVLSLFALFRNVRSSLPGAWLYPVKILGENMGGVLLTSAGEQATWHAYQTENRLQELVYLAQQDKVANADLEQTLDQEVMATLAASNHLSPAQRNEFLQAWLTRLQAIDKDSQWPNTATLTLNRTLATIQAATQATIAQPVLGPEHTPTGVPTPKLADSHIIIPTTTANPATDELLVTEQATPPATAANAWPLAPVVIHPATIAPALAPAELLVLATATTAAIIVQVPQATSSADDHRRHAPHKTAVSQPESTTAASVSAAASTQTLASGNAGSGEVQTSTSPTTSVETALDKASATDNLGIADAPIKTPTPSFGVVDNPTPATDSGPAIAPTTPLVTEEVTSATPDQTASSGTGTPSIEKTDLPTGLTTIATTPIALPSGTASNPATPPNAEPEKTVEPSATDEPTDRPKPTPSTRPTKTPEPADTPDRSTSTVETPPTATPDSTPTPKKHK